VLASTPESDDGGLEAEPIVPEISLATLTGVALVEEIRFAGFVQPASMASDLFDYAVQVVVGDDSDEDGDDSAAGYAIAELASADGTGPGDLDGNGVVDEDDLAAWKPLYLRGDARADLNRDGAVDGRDLELLKRRIVGGGSGSGNLH
jgi:hypothetical protein